MYLFKQMLYVYNYFKDFSELRKNSVDLSLIPSCDLADQCEILLKHQKDCKVFLGYVEIGWMLDPKHEARIREVIRKFHTTMVCFHLKSIPFSWKNEIDIVYLEKKKNGVT
jgi:hypothetical protein